MQQDIVNISLALIEGFALIISPCILPILPIILAASIDGSKKRPYGILVGFITSFALFTFFSRKLVLIFGIDLELIRYISFALLLLFGFTMLSNYLTAKFGHLTQGLANYGTRLISNNTDSDFSGGVFFGSLVGLIWTPCAGPILAAVIVQSILQDTSVAGFFTILAFGISAAIPMTIIIIFGRIILASIIFFQNKAYLIRKILGLTIIYAVIFMMFGIDLFQATPNSHQTEPMSSDHMIDGLSKPYPAPDFNDITAWINTEPLKIQQLRGKVVLVDFWAYSCINCIRTLPYLSDWYQKYHDKGLVIIGAHAPEFDFEHSEENVHKAVKKFSIHYPIALDNNFATWRNYQNHYWPAHYLINKDGMVVYEHFGEGAYNISENNIRYLLGINSRLKVKGETVNTDHHQTPETYLGFARSDQYASPQSMVMSNSSSYTYPKDLKENAWSLNGDWTIAAAKIISQKTGAAIKLHFYAKRVFAVMGTNGNKAIKIKVLINNKPNDKLLEIKDHTLYPLVDLQKPESATLELISPESGLELYTFTFGN